MPRTHRPTSMTRVLAAATLAFGLAVLAPSAPVQATPAQAAPAPAGVKAEIIRSIEDAEKKLIALAERFPQEKYAWHPEGARTTSEVFMHIAAANYAYGGLMGAARAEGKTGVALSKITEKAQLVETLKDSFTYIKAAIVNAADVEKTIKLRAGDATLREAMIGAATHCHEHMGQLIAYARVNGIVPPWNEAPPAKN
ncbi:MAG TPA: DinB family protein [Candidatus Acidoferrales bacterium]|nr:DinB family protein [Candidatus Acidoferrales bacterium]